MDRVLIDLDAARSPAYPLHLSAGIARLHDRLQQGQGHDILQYILHDGHPGASRRYHTRMQHKGRYSNA